MILVGNKIDLNGARKVDVDQAKAFAEANGMSYIETSALQSTNVSASFELLVSQVYYRTIVQRLDQTDGLTNITGQSGGVHIHNPENTEKKFTLNCCGTS